MRTLFSFFLILYAIALQATTTATIQQLINQYLPDAHVGVWVQRADTGQILVNIQGKQHFTPASTAKLFTAYTALKTLGPDFRFETNVYYHPAALQNGIYKDAIYIQFSGDPSLSTEHLAQFVSRMKAVGIQKIEGPIILDITHVPVPYYGMGWAQEDLAWYFAAPISAAIIDENQINLQLLLTETLNQPIPAKVMGTPPLPVTSYLMSAREADTKHLCQFNSSMDSNNRITLYGCWPAAKGPVALKMALANPTQRITQILQMQFNHEQIHFTGSFKEGKTPNTVSVLAQQASDPAAKLLQPVLERSNNIYTEALAKKIGAQQYKRATFQAGSYAISQFCDEDLKLPPDSLALFDGSGLSTYNLATPESLALLLKAAYNNTVMRPIFLETLARSGEKGTLGARMASKDLIGKFVGKTGAMSHVSNLAGYLFTSAQESPLIVVIMINQTTVKKPTLFAFENALMRALIAGRKTKDGR